MPKDDSQVAIDVEDIQKGMVFASNFAQALFKMKAGITGRQRVVLSFQEAQAVIDGLQMLRKGKDGQG